MVLYEGEYPGRVALDADNLSTYYGKTVLLLQYIHIYVKRIKGVLLFSGYPAQEKTEGQ